MPSPGSSCDGVPTTTTVGSTYCFAASPTAPARPLFAVGRMLAGELGRGFVLFCGWIACARRCRSARLIPRLHRNEQLQRSDSRGKADVCVNLEWSAVGVFIT